MNTRTVGRLLIVLGGALGLGLGFTGCSSPDGDAASAGAKSEVGSIPTTALYNRLGGEPAIKMVVDDFVARAAANPKVNFTRVGTGKEWKPTAQDMDHLKKMLVQFISMASGGPQKYEGRSMKEVHQGMKITAAEFGALAGDLNASLDHFKVKKQEKDELLAAVAGTINDIVEK